MLISAVIPAAGLSQRMGSAKTTLTTEKKLTFAGHLVDVFTAFGCNPVIMVVNEEFNPATCPTGDAIIVLNRRLDKGRSWSILLGLKRVPEYHACFIQNVDNPFLELSLLEVLAGAVTGNSHVMPIFQGHGGHPLLLGSEVVDHLRNMDELPDFRQELKSFAGYKIPYHDERILLNINTPADYRAYIG